MAEAFGLLASGIAVAQATHALGKLAVSLTRLWRDVRDVPDTIRLLVDQLELTTEMVGFIEAELSLPSPPASPLSLLPSPPPSSLCFPVEREKEEPLNSMQRRAIERCRHAQGCLQALVDDLATEIASSRRRRRVLAGVKVALKREVLEGYERRLGAAVGLLNAVVTMQVASSTTRQPDLIAARVAEVLVANRGMGVEPLSPPPSPVTDLVPSPQLVEEADEAVYEKERAVVVSSREITTSKKVVTHRRTYSYSTLLGSVNLGLSQVEEKGALTRASKSNRYRFQLTAPTWLMERSWEVQLSTACSGWKAFFRSYVVVPACSQLFSTLVAGTSQELFDLFDKGLASPFSIRDGTGQTLLHAAMEHRFDLVEPLLRMGLDLKFEDDYHRPAYELSPSLGNRSFAVEVHQLLVSHDIYDEVDWCDTWVHRRMIEHVEVFDWFLANVFQDFYHWPLERRLEIFDDPCEVTFDYRVINRVFRPHGGLRPEDLLHPVSPDQTPLFEWVNVAYFAAIDAQWIARSQPSIYKDPDLGQRVKQMRPAIREIAAILDYKDLAALSCCHRTTYMLRIIILLLELNGFWCRTGMRPSLTYRIQQRDAQHLMRAWIEEVHASGKDLDRYAAAEYAALACYPGCKHWKQGMMLYKMPWPRLPSGYKFKGITTGPQPEDWKMVWEWDPDVARYVGEFWDAVENPRTQMPGSWVCDGPHDDCGGHEHIMLHCGAKH